MRRLTHICNEAFWCLGTVQVVLAKLDALSVFSIAQQALRQPTSNGAPLLRTASVGIWDHSQDWTSDASLGCSTVTIEDTHTRAPGDTISRGFDTAACLRLAADPSRIVRPTATPTSSSPTALPEFCPPTPLPALASAAILRPVTLFPAASVP